MDPKSLAALEYPKIIERLAAHCQTPAGARAALELEPSSDLDEIRARLAATAQARALARLKPNFSIGAIPDIADRLLALSRGALLPTQDIADVASVLRSARRVRNQLSPLARDIPALARIAARIDDFSDPIAAVDRCIDERGEVPDQASPELAELRNRARTLHSRLETSLNSVLRRAVADGIAQEPILTERAGRLVIPLKAEARSALPCVVHDVSASGATVFVEPLSVVELGNRLREARLREAREVERILRRLCARLGAQSGAIRAAIERLAALDLAQAKARLGADLDAPLPAERDDLRWLDQGPDAETHLLSARHPLLSGDVTPISAALARDRRCVLITGPNTGGKTVALKTIGLLALMAQAGLPLPLEQGSRLAVFNDVFADIGDEQSIEQSLSTFSAHMTNIIRILAAAGPDSLVLLDELGAGTDPAEGAALARSILEELLQLDAAVIATTHHGELKLFAHQAEGIVNASTEFNADTLQPAYKLLMGTPGRSNAFAIAQRLGMPREILQRARRARQDDPASPETVEGLLAELQRERDALQHEREAEQAAVREAEQIRADLAARRDAIEDERQSLLARAERQIEDDLANVRRSIRSAERDLRKAAKRQPGASTADAETHVDAVRDRLEDVRRRRRGRRGRKPQTESIDHAALAKGDIVYLAGLSEPGSILEPLHRGSIQVQVGSLRMRVRPEQIERLAPARPTAEGDRGRTPPPPPDPGPRTDVRGNTADDALPIVERFLDDAYRAGRTRLAIVHGYGTGALRRAVRAMLRQHPLVSALEAAPPREGGDGATIVTLIG